MPVNWNPEAEAKLFLGVLAQFKDANMKLDYKALAEYMGPECSVSAVKQRVQKLRRDAESPPATGDGNANDATGATASSPAGAQKRKTTGGGRKGGRKKAKKSEEKKTEEETAEEEAEKIEE